MARIGAMVTPYVAQVSQAKLNYIPSFKPRVNWLKFTSVCTGSVQAICIISCWSIRSSCNTSCLGVYHAAY